MGVAPERIGLTPAQLALVLRLLSSLRSAARKGQGWLFGSRARGDFRRYSDLDLLVEVEPPATKAELRSLREAFDDSDLPYTVDVVSSIDLADSYRERVLVERQLLVDLALP